MDSKSLMIGDWVQYDNEETLPCKIASIASQIAQDEWGQAYCTCIFPDGCMNVCKGTLKPIPLSVEILEKNGFIQDDSYSEYIAETFSEEFLIWHYYADELIISYDASEELTISYNFGHPCKEICLYRPNVHELQHALRLCGLDKLAENFKV